MSRRASVALSVAVLLVSALAAGVILRVGAEDGSGNDTAGDAVGAVASGGATRATDVPIPVEGTEAILDTLVLAVKANGRAAPARTTTILAQVAGRVARVAVSESDGVGAGRTLVAIDPAEYQLAVDDAEAQVRRAEAEYRSITLFDERIRATRARSSRTASSSSLPAHAKVLALGRQHASLAPVDPRYAHIRNAALRVRRSAMAR